MSSISFPKLLIGVILFMAAYLLFEYIQPRYFRPSGAVSHIIDSHLMPEKNRDTSCKAYGARFFDASYVRDALGAYDRKGYLKNFFPLDLVFPFVYGFLFLTLVSGWKKARFYRLMIVIVAACMFFDISENFSFAWFLFHPDTGLNELVAICTTVKSILFFLSFVFSISGFIYWCYRKWKK